jgi:hypothetical protein
MPVTDDSRSSRDIDTALAEDRRFPPDEVFAAAANADAAIYERDFDEFWTSEARARISWFRDFHTLYEWQLPYAKWYLGGSLNVCYNCVDRHSRPGRATGSPTTGKASRRANGGYSRSPTFSVRSSGSPRA